MAHPMVESLKTMGMRHGEKVVVGLFSLLCVVMVILAGSKDTIDTTPDQIAQATKSAQQTLNKPQSTEDIVAILDNEGLVPQNFAQKAELVAKRDETKPYTWPGAPWVYTEPGAGLIRDDIKRYLIAPQELYATSNRGSIQLISRTSSGEIEYEDPKKADEKKKSGITLPPSVLRRRGMATGSSSSSAGMMAMGSSGMMGMGQPKTPTAEEKKKREEEARRRAQLFRGLAKDEEEKKMIDMAMEGRKPKEVTKGVRLVAIIGVLDHQKLKDNYAKALKDSNAAPHYLRLELQRQALRDEQWGDWEDIDRQANEYIQNNMVEREEELATDDVRLEGLVDMLPFFKVGYYSGVHVAEFVPKSQREIAPIETVTGSEFGMPGMMVGAPGSMSADPAMMMSRAGMMGMDTAGPMAMGSGMEMMGMGMGMAGPGGPEDTNFAKTNAERIMIRGLDFTVVPDSVYRYRVRIVVRNPNYGWEPGSLAPGTDNSNEEIAGPWSEPTDVVRVPADVSLFAVRKLNAAGTRSDSIQFQLVKFNPDDGLTIVKELNYAPGQIVGTQESAAVPNDDGKGRKSKAIDFTSRQLLLDTAGGRRSVSTFGVQAAFESPVMGLVLRPDGTLVVRDESRDATDSQLKQMSDIYNQILKDADEGGKKHPENAMMDAMMMPGS